MANWINRTTFEFLQSRDPAPADQAAWLRLGADHPAELTGSPDNQDWKVVGETVVLKAESVRVPRIRSALIASVNARTADLIGHGFQHAGLTFSLSLTAQANLQDLFARRASLTWPVTVEPTDDEAEHALADQAEGAAYYLAARAAINGHRSTGRAIKSQLRAATTLAELSAVVDDR